MVRQEVRYLDDQTCKDASLSTMMNVVKLENGEKRFVCRECGNSYSHHTSLYRHFKNAHTEKYKQMSACREKIREDQRLAKTFGLPYFRLKNEKRNERSTTNKNQNKENAPPPTSTEMEQSDLMPSTSDNHSDFFDALIEETWNRNQNDIEPQTSVLTCTNASTSQETAMQSNRLLNDDMDLDVDRPEYRNWTNNLPDKLSELTTLIGEDIFEETITEPKITENSSLPNEINQTISSDHLLDLDVSQNKPKLDSPKSKDDSPMVKKDILKDAWQEVMSDVPEQSLIEEGCAKSSNISSTVKEASVQKPPNHVQIIQVANPCIPKHTIVKKTLKRALNMPMSEVYHDQPPIKIVRKDVSRLQIQNNSGPFTLKECHKCFRKYLKKNDLDRHVKSCTGPRTINLTNGISNVFQKEKVKIALDKPVSTNISESGTPLSNPIVLNNVSFKCDICGLAFRDLISIANHGCQRT